MDTVHTKKTWFAVALTDFLLVFFPRKNTLQQVKYNTKIVQDCPSVHVPLCSLSVATCFYSFAHTEFIPHYMKHEKQK